MVILLANAINSQIVLLNSFMKTYLWLSWVFIFASELSLVAVTGRLLFVLVPRLLTVVASLVAEHRL